MLHRRTTFIASNSIRLAGAVLLLSLTSCGGEQAGQRPVFPTTGKVFYQGQPATGATVILQPLDPGPDSDWRLGYPSGTVAADGSVQIQTYGENDGAPEGEYAILVTWPSDTTNNEEALEEDTADRLAGRYADAASSLWRIKVEQKPTELPSVDLK